MAGGSAPSLPPSASLFCLSHLCYCRGLACSPLLPFSCPVALTLICQSCPAVPCHPRKLRAGGGERRKGRNASTLAGLQAIVPGGPLSVVKPPSSSSYSRFFLLRSFTSFFFAIVAQNNRTSNRKLPHVRLVSCDVKP